MFSCPHCRKHLERQAADQVVFWRCPSCEGRTFTIPVLRRIMRKDYVNQLWQASADVERGACACPMCNNAMSPVQNLLPDEHRDISIEIDVCRACHSVWFDPHEVDAIAERVPAPPKPAADPELSPQAREVLAMAKVEVLRERAEADAMCDTTPPAEGWQALLTVFGFPVEENSSALSRWPYVTWAIALLMALATTWALWLGGGSSAFDRWGLVPAMPFRDYGLTFLTSFFLHGGLLHLVGNAIFLFIFGDNVEDYLGHIRFFLLLAGASLAGDFLHIIFEPHGQLPCIGASGGISGIIAFYACQFPKARLVYMLRYGVFVRWIRFPAWVALIFWLVIQGVGVFEQMIGISNVSALAHLGGAAFGFFFWLITCRASRLAQKPQ